jgi:circadian clock protein KaiB
MGIEPGMYFQVAPKYWFMYFRRMNRAVEQWVIYLYVAGRRLALSTQAEANLRRLCDKYLKGAYRIQVVDLMEEPALAKEHGIVATPMVVRIKPVPFRKFIGTLANEERARFALGCQQS